MLYLVCDHSTRRKKETCNKEQARTLKTRGTSWGWATGKAAASSEGLQKPSHHVKLSVSSIFSDAYLPRSPHPAMHTSRAVPIRRVPTCRA